MRIIIYIFLILGWGVLSSRAQTLEAYFEIAAENNPGLQAKYLEYEIAMQKIPQVSSLQDPSFSFGYFISPVETRVGPQRAKFSLSQMFPWFGTLKARGDAAALMAEAKFQLFIDERNRLFYRVAAAYYPIYELEKVIAIEKENLEILDSYQAIARSNFRNNTSPMVDVLRVEILRDDAMTNLEILAKKRKPLLTAFNKVLNREPGERVALETPDMGTADMGTVEMEPVDMGTVDMKPEDILEPPHGVGSKDGVKLAVGSKDGVGSKDAVGSKTAVDSKAAGDSKNGADSKNGVKLAVDSNATLGSKATVGSAAMSPFSENYRRDSLLTGHPALNALDLKIRSTEAAEVAARKQGLPKIGAGLDYVIVGEGPLAAADNGRDVLMPMVSLSIPIFREKYNASVRAAQLSQEQFRLQKKEVANTLESEYELARFELEQQHELLDLYRRQVQTSEQSLSLLFTAYGNSGKDFDEVLRMQQQLLKYEKLAAAAEAKAGIARARINYLTAKTN